MKKYIFGYGSLMNPHSLAKTISPRETTRGTLVGFQRRMNALLGEFLYLNIVPRAEKHVSGVLIPVSDHDIDLLKVRERPYDLVDVTDQMLTPIEGVVFAFIAPDVLNAEYRVSRSYINTCLGGVPHEHHERWLSDTLIEGDIHEDVL